jgi:NADPH-dependent curcumin reductase
VFDAVLPLFRQGARMTICGLIAHYGDADGSAGSRAALMKRGEPIFKARNVSVKNLRVGDFAAEHHGEMLSYVAPLVAAGRTKYREDIRHGLEIIPSAFARCCAGTISARCWYG